MPLKRRGGPSPKVSQKDKVFVKQRTTAAPSPSSKNGKSKGTKSVAKPSKEDEEDYLSDELMGGDGFFEDSGKDSRKTKEASDSGSDSEEENADEIRLRQGKAYLQKVMRSSNRDSNESDSDEEETGDSISAKLAEDALQATGKMSFRNKADALKGSKGSSFEIKVLRGHKQPVTASRISDDETTVYSAGKDCSIIKWDLGSGKKLAVYRGKRGSKSVVGHEHHIYALALSSDGKYLASGGKDKTIIIWDTTKDDVRDGFTGHKDAITALTFRLGSHDLYSGSDDRTLKLWNIDEMSYVDTLFGHKAEITAIDALTRERAVTSSLDKTSAVWKIADEVHLEYLGPKTQLYSIAMLTEDIFVSGGMDGTIHLWSMAKRRPIFELKLAHGEAPHDSFNWITSLAGLRYSDLFASGSGTGEVLLWKLSEAKDSFSLITRIPLVGIINSLQFSKNGTYIVAGVGQEPRMGRWVKVQAARNGTHIIKLPVVPEKPSKK